MVSDRHLARQKLILEWVETDECPEDLKANIRAAWEMVPTFPSMEKAIWDATRTELKDYDILSAMKNIDAVRLEMGESVAQLEEAFIAIHDEHGEHLLQRGKNGVYAPYDSSTHYAEVMVNEIINRKRKA
jgi:hypothetical protein